MGVEIPFRFLVNTCDAPHPHPFLLKYVNAHPAFLNNFQGMTGGISADASIVEKKCIYVPHFGDLDNVVFWNAPWPGSQARHTAQTSVHCHIVKCHSQQHKTSIYG